MDNKNIHIASEAIQQDKWTIKGENWMSQNASDLLKLHMGPPQSITATITTEEGHTYKGVLYLAEEYSGPFSQVQKSIFGKIPLSPFEWLSGMGRDTWEAHISSVFISFFRSNDEQ